MKMQYWTVKMNLFFNCLVDALLLHLSPLNTLRQAFPWFLQSVRPPSYSCCKNAVAGQKSLNE